MCVLVLCARRETHFVVVHSDCVPVLCHTATGAIGQRSLSVCVPHCCSTDRACFMAARHPCDRRECRLKKTGGLEQTTDARAAACKRPPANVLFVFLWQRCGRRAKPSRSLGSVAKGLCLGAERAHKSHNRDRPGRTLAIGVVAPLLEVPTLARLPNRPTLQHTRIKIRPSAVCVRQITRDLVTSESASNEPFDRYWIDPVHSAYPSLTDSRSCIERGKGVSWRQAQPPVDAEPSP